MALTSTASPMYINHLALVSIDAQTYKKIDANENHLRRREDQNYKKIGAKKTNRKRRKGHLEMV